jgi:Ca2+-binding EF-hand superfamily protein
MKPAVVMAVALATAAVAWPCTADAKQPPPIGAIPLNKVLDVLDRNANGCVDLEEGRNYASRRFHALDRNGDDSVDATEAPPGPEETTNDRPISLNDWQDAYHARFTRFDTDGSGCLSLQEVQDGRAKGGR